MRGMQENRQRALFKRRWCIMDNRKSKRMSSAECKSIKCNNKQEEGLTFCNYCLSGMLSHELCIDDLVPGLENAIEANWERIKKQK